MGIFGETGIQAELLLAFITLLTIGLMFLINHLLSDLDRYYEKLDECETELDEEKGKVKPYVDETKLIYKIPKKISIPIKHVKSGFFPVSFGVIAIFALVLWFLTWITGILIICDDLNLFWWIPIPIILVITYFCGEYLEYIKEIFERFKKLRGEIKRIYNPKEKEKAETYNLKNLELSILLEWKKFWTIFLFWGFFTVIFLVLGINDPFFNWMGLLSFCFASLVPFFCIKAAEWGEKYNKDKSAIKIPENNKPVKKFLIPFILLLISFFVLSYVYILGGIPLYWHDIFKWLLILSLALVVMALFYCRFIRGNHERFKILTLCNFSAGIVALVCFVDRDFLHHSRNSISNIWLLILAFGGFIVIITGLSKYFFEIKRKQKEKDASESGEEGEENKTGLWLIFVGFFSIIFAAGFYGFNREFNLIPSTYPIIIYIIFAILLIIPTGLSFNRIISFENKFLENHPSSILSEIEKKIEEGNLSGATKQVKKLFKNLPKNDDKLRERNLKKLKDLIEQNPNIKSLNEYEDFKRSMKSYLDI